MRQFTVLRCWWRALGGVALALTLGALGLTEAQVVELRGNRRRDILDPASRTFLPRDKDRYRIPTAEDLDAWRQVMRAMLHGKLETAAKLVTPLAPSYKVIKFTDTFSTPARVYHLLLEADLNGRHIMPRAVTGWGLYAFDPTPVRDLAISIPHMKADTNTELEGIEALVTLRPASLLLFTSHRCASDTRSSCDGSTTACAGGFRVSDASHGGAPSPPTFTTTTFQVAHAAKRFLIKAIRRHDVPAKITIAGSAANEAAIKSYNQEHGTAITIRQRKYLNNVVEQGHRAVKRVTRPMLGFKSFEAAQNTLVGIELMHMIKKRQMVVEAGEESLTAAELFYALAA